MGITSALNIKPRDRCSNCGSDDGCYQSVTGKYEQHYDWQGSENGASDINAINKTALRCINCNKLVKNNFL